MNLSSFINWATNNLLKLYPQNEAKAMAVMLLKEMAHCKDYEYLVNPQKDLQLVSSDSKIEEKLIDAVNRCALGEPLQYVLGYEFFCSHKFNVAKGVLIPRPETEELVAKINKSKKFFNPDKLRILDICTGSGCIAHSLAYNMFKGSVFACDISQQALEIACGQKIYRDEKNIVPKFFICDILSSNAEVVIKEYCGGEGFDIIVSNPPYVCLSEKSLMRKNVLDYEPEIALFVEDNNPLVFYEQIISLSKSLLNSNGKLFFEINEQFGKQIKDLFIANGYLNAQILKDLNGKDRMAVGDWVK